MSDWITPDEVKEHHDNGYEAGVAHERERITKILLQRLEYFDCDICGECVTPTRLVEMITDK